MPKTSFIVFKFAYTIFTKKLTNTVSSNLTKLLKFRIALTSSRQRCRGTKRDVQKRSIHQQWTQCMQCCRLGEKLAFFTDGNLGWMHYFLEILLIHFSLIIKCDSHFCKVILCCLNITFHPSSNTNDL